MKQQIRDLLAESIRNEAANNYGFDSSQLTDLHGFQNFVYEASRDNVPYILRIAHSSHRSIDMIEAELKWIQFLSCNGVNAAAPIMSLNGELLHKISYGEEDAYFIASAFNKAPGMKPGWQAYGEDKQMIKRLGQLTGQIHALSKLFTSEQGTLQRSNWMDNNYLVHFEEYIPDAYVYVVEKVSTFLEGLAKLPRDDASYGLIHGDIHLNNFHVHNGEPTLFDFDECEYNWFAADIANPLFYATPLPSDGKEARERIAQRFYDYFMEGYSQANTLNEYWLKRIPLFLRMREILVYSGAFRSLDLNNLHPWSKEMLETTTNNLMHDLPFLEIKYS